MQIVYFYISFLISSYFLKILKNKIKIKKQFDIYISSLKKLKVESNNSDETKIILDKISISGSKLIVYIVILLVPYLFCFLALFGLLKNYPLSIIISCLPYFYFFTIKNESI